MFLSNSELADLICSPSRLRALNDEDLLLALRSGCNDALVVLFERYGPTVLQAARPSLQDDTAAEEIVREVFQDVVHTIIHINSTEDFLLRLLQNAYWRIMACGKYLHEPN